MIKPTGKNILINVEQEEEKTKSGIYIGKKDVIMEVAEVIEVGEEVTKVKKGQKVMFKSYNLDVIVVDEKENQFIEESLILAIVE